MKGVAGKNHLTMMNCWKRGHFVLAGIHLYGNKTFRVALHLVAELSPCSGQPGHLAMRVVSSGGNTIITCLRYRNIEIEIEAQNGSRDQDDKHRKRSIFKIRQLNLHAPKLYPPTNRRVRRRRFESQGLPIRRLEILHAEYWLNENLEKQKPTSKWSLLVESSWSIVSENTTRGSRMNRCEMCFDSRSSMPATLLLTGKRHVYEKFYHVVEGAHIQVRHRAQKYHCTPACWPNLWRGTNPHYHSGILES